MKSFGLIGFPLSHSFSAKYFGEKFTRENISDCQYQNYSIEKIELLPNLILNNSNLCGLNVTIPYKEKVMDYMNDLDTTAQEIGAVNTIKFIRQNNTLKLKGYNTDEYGFRNSLLPFIKTHHKSALILGTGGASKAIKYVLKSLNISFITATRKVPSKDEINYENIDKKIIEEYTLIINSTPLGTYPNVDESPQIPYEFITPNHILYDLVYNPELTKFLFLGKEKNAVIINGLNMLHLQAEKAWEIWNS